MLPRFENNPKVPRKLFDIALCYLKSAIKVLHDKMFKIQDFRLTNCLTGQLFFV